MDKIKIDLERLTVRDCILMSNGKMTFAKQMAILDKVVIDGVMELPITRLSEVMSLFNIELGKFAKYMKPEQGLNEAFDIAKKRWAEDDEKED